MSAAPESIELAGARAEIELLYRMLLVRQRFDHAILDGVEVGIITADDDGIVTFVNRCAARLLEVDAEIEGTPVERVLGLACGPNELLGTELRRSLAYALRTRDGVELDLDLAVSRGEGGHEQGVGFFFIFRDVREEKMREAERRRFERLVAMGTMVAGFAHEVRNPVAALRSIAEELLEELEASGVAMPHLGRMLQMVERIERLVKTSLQFGRPAVPKRAHQRPWVIASSALAELRPRLRGPDEELRVEAEPDLPDVNVDERQLAQALVILLNNALDATGAPSRVLMRVRRARPTDQDTRRGKSDPPMPPAVRFEVIDDGPGIAPEILGQIFDPFFTTKPTGTGLGLSIAQQIVNENGARLEVVSIPARTTSFSHRRTYRSTRELMSTILDTRLRAREPSQHGSAAMLTTGMGKAAKWEGRPACVLVVEDDPLVRSGVCGSLRLLGFEVLEADSCESATQVFTAQRPDVVVTDLRLPDGEALELLPRLRRLDAGVPVFIVTGYGTIDVAVRAVKEGAEDFLTKPVDLDALGRVVMKAVERRRHQRAGPRARLDSGSALVSPPSARASEGRMIPIGAGAFEPRSASMKRVEDQVERLRDVDCSVLLLGETGTGKSVLARRIHAVGARGSAPFVDINCAGLSKEFVETELFGHERGAFTGAHVAKQGLLDAANGGTLFLDEIGDVDVQVQPKLLKVLEEKRFRRMGDVRERSVDVRLISIPWRWPSAWVSRGPARCDPNRADLKGEARPGST